MSRALNQHIRAEVPKRLAELLVVPANRVSIKQEQVAPANGDGRPDFTVSVGDLRFVVECRLNGHAAAVAMAARSARECAKQWKKRIPLVAVPYMGEVGRKLCEELDVCWLDLSGNAHLIAPGLRVDIEGKPNLFKRPGRPRSVFAPKSARVARSLLMDPDRAFTQRALAKETGLDEGFTSRIVRKLEEQHLVARDEAGRVKVASYGAMLDAWHEDYDFSKHHILRGHIAARSSDAILRGLSEQLRRSKIEHAATGLAAAWLLDAFAGFRLVVFYVAQIPSAEARDAMGFHEEQRGENVWLVVPNDEGVFRGASEHESIRCVHPVQVYLDLKGHPERSAEAATHLRAKLLAKNAQA
jgi:DNA-binding MarR family transcriptional regulator